MSENIEENGFSISFFWNSYFLMILSQKREVYSLLGVTVGVMVGGVHLYLGDIKYEHEWHQV